MNYLDISTKVSMGWQGRVRTLRTPRRVLQHTSVLVFVGMERVSVGSRATRERMEVRGRPRNVWRGFTPSLVELEAGVFEVVEGSVEEEGSREEA